MTLENFRNQDSRELPIKIQKAFESQLTKMAGSVLKSYPDRLFSITTFPQLEPNDFPKYGHTNMCNVQRRYFMLNPATEEFTMSDSVFLKPDDSAIICINPEGGYNDQLTLGIGRDYLCFAIIQDEDKIEFEYDSNGRIKQILLLTRSGADMGFFIGYSELPVEQYSRITGLRRTANFDGKNILVEQYKGELLTDRVEFPAEVDPRKVIRRIFDPKTLEDPINADLKLDLSWRDPVRIQEAFGFRWDKTPRAYSN